MSQLTKRALYFLMAVVFLAGCEKLFPKKQPKITAAVEPAVVEVKGTLIAKVNNQPITLEELNEEIENYNNAIESNPNLTPDDKSKGKIVTRDKKMEYLKDQMIHRALLAQAAVDRGLDRKEEVQKALNNFKQNLLVAELVRQETANIEISHAEIEKNYNLYKEQLFREPEERRIREIVVASESDAKDVLIELLKGADFATLAQERSISASAKNGGYLGDLKKGAKSPQFDEVAFSSTLDVGKTSNYFKGPDGYYIIKVEAKKGGALQSLSDSWDYIKNILTVSEQEKIVNDLISNLSQKAKIEVIDSAVK